MGKTEGTYAEPGGIEGFPLDDRGVSRSLLATLPFPNPPLDVPYTLNRAIELFMH